MRTLGQKGIATVPVVVIVLISTGAAVVTPAVVDLIDVDPDSPFYGLERLGEKIRMVSEDDQMMERWTEYVHLVDRAKGVEYEHILEEFTEKINKTVSSDAITKRGVVEWMEEHLPEVKVVRVKLMKELCEKLKKRFPELSVEVDNEIQVLDDILEEVSSAAVQSTDNIQARIELMAHRLQGLAGQQGQMPGDLSDYFRVENILADVNITIDVEVVTAVQASIITISVFDDALSKFNGAMSEIQAMLEGAPENTLSKNVVEKLVDISEQLKENSISAMEKNETRSAFTSVSAARIHLTHAKAILEHADEWEPSFSDEWSNWKKSWEILKQEWKETGIWQNMLDNYQNYAQQVMEQWQETMQKSALSSAPPS